MLLYACGYSCAELEVGGYVKYGGAVIVESIYPKTACSKEKHITHPASEP
jgi:hypothetical protein